MGYKKQRMGKKVYWYGEFHNIKEIGQDTKRNLRLYRPQRRRGVWIIDSSYNPSSKDLIMKRKIRLKRIKKG